jgi:alginate O-acetyltransferase complex protein AlgI
MIFSSPIFFLFFAIYLPLHFLIPAKHRVSLIVIGSTIFYGYYRPVYIWIPFTLTAGAYAGAILIDSATKTFSRKLRLAGTIIVLLMPLMFYKYADFFYLSVIGPLFSWTEPIVDLPLPLGISFITFTLIAYAVDVYKGRFPVERSYKTLSAYILFFPQLIAGPILKPGQLIPQLKDPEAARNGSFTYGAIIFTLGLVKKLIFADSIAVVVDSVYSAAPNSMHITDYIIAIYGFPMQIYCDFSGYTDMALGLGYILGITLPNNFSRPYTASSLVEFWRRWHITLSFWLRDYLYIPLGGNRKGIPKELRNIMITMTLGGLWHGASWTFVVWGALHGLGILAFHLTRKKSWIKPLTKIPKWICTLFTFHFVTLLWIFFRAPDFSTISNVLSGPFNSSLSDMSSFISNNGFILFILSFFYLTHILDDHAHFYYLIHKVPKSLAWVFIIFMFVLAVALSGGNSAAFIYFDF